MSDQAWIAFPARRDGPPRVLSVDFGLRDGFPHAGRPWCVRLTLPFRVAGASALPEASENERMNGLADRAEAALAAFGVRLVAQATGGGAKSFVWYAARGEGVATAVRAAVGEGECDVASDPEWEAYREHLPTAREHQSLAAQQIRSVLAEKGDDGTAPRDVRHYAYFENPEARSRAAVDLAALGFAIEQPGPAAEAAPPAFCLIASKDDAVAFAPCEAFIDVVFDVVTSAGGEYDGWECAVVEPPPSPPAPKKGVFGRLFGG